MREIRRPRLVCSRNDLVSPILDGTVVDADISPDWSELPSAGPRFRRLLEHMDWDVAELPLVTYLIARSHGRPLELLPLTVQARFQHPYFVVDQAKGTSLHAIRTVGVRTHTATTVLWIKAMLRERAIDPHSIRWLAMDDGDLPGHSDPPPLGRMPPGDLRLMLAQGEIDAAVLPDFRGVPDVQPVLGEPEACARDWLAQHGSVQINHVLVANTARCSPEVSRAFAGLVARAKSLLDARRCAGEPDMFPVGWAAMESSVRLLEAEARAGGLLLQ
jgi:4,5-dihydroxyphthalate decarboxylase